jgi:hypothetical protein
VLPAQVLPLVERLDARQQIFAMEIAILAQAPGEGAHRHWILFDVTHDWPFPNASFLWPGFVFRTRMEKSPKRASRYREGMKKKKTACNERSVDGLLQANCAMMGQPRTKTAQIKWASPKILGDFLSNIFLAWRLLPTVCVERERDNDEQPSFKQCQNASPP